MNFVWGIAGAFVYAIGALIFALWADGTTRGKRAQALAEFFAALATGAIFAAGFADVLTSWIAAGLIIDGVRVYGSVGSGTVALTIGWCSNYVWPRVLRKLGQKIEAGKVEGVK